MRIVKIYQKHDGFSEVQKGNECCILQPEISHELSAIMLSVTSLFHNPHRS